MARAPREAPERRAPKRATESTAFDYWRWPPQGHPDCWTIPEASAIQAIIRGDPTRDQCKRFVAWMEKASMLYAQSYSPLSDRDSVFAEGRRFVGRWFVILSKLNLGKFTRNGSNDLETE